MKRITNFSFSPIHLEIATRKPGISAFLRTRNGADFLEPTIRSHIDHYDEIVAVYNTSEDSTEALLLRLEQEFQGRLRVFHYADEVFPPGSEGHKVTPPNSPNSMVNYTNFALAQTSFNVVVKLDDDHIAERSNLKKITNDIRRLGYNIDSFWGFSGLNLARTRQGSIGILRSEPFSGSGDIGYFQAGQDRYFHHDRRFERFDRGPLRAEFKGFLYWHMKYLKQGGGFQNYNFTDNPKSRFIKKQQSLSESLSHESGIFHTWSELKSANTVSLRDRVSAVFVRKAAFLSARKLAIQAGPAYEVNDDVLALIPKT